MKLGEEGESILSDAEQTRENILSDVERTSVSEQGEVGGANERKRVSRRISKLCGMSISYNAGTVLYILVHKRC